MMLEHWLKANNLPFISILISHTPCVISLDDFINSLLCIVFLLYFFPSRGDLGTLMDGESFINFYVLALCVCCAYLVVGEARYSALFAESKSRSLLTGWGSA